MGWKSACNGFSRLILQILVIQARSAMITLTHTPVLEKEVVELLLTRSDAKFLDCTLGPGGHALALLKACDRIEICGLDRDENALKLARERLAGYKSRVNFFHLPYSNFGQALESLGWSQVDGVLLDLGISSLQVDSAERGFSFRHNGPLDMRMDTSSHECNAADLVNHATFTELKEIIAVYGEEPMAARIARKIVEAREKSAIKDTTTLAKLVVESYPANWRQKARNNPATRTFQALRIKVNDEIGELKSFLGNILPRLSLAGKLLIISFHSLEDRLVKTTFRSWAKGCVCPPEILLCQCGHKPEVEVLLKKPLTASATEIAENPRAKSAKLRAIKKIWSPV